MTHMLRAHSFLSLVIIVGSLVVASSLGQRVTFPNLVPWYAHLVKPSFNPPNWIFGPVWTGLYAMMALAAWRVVGSNSHGKNVALLLFAVQLTLNVAWSWLFFALHSPLLGLFDIVPQWLAILFTIRRFSAIDRLAGLCLLPLAAWVGFATLLNFEIWRLN